MVVGEVESEVVEKTGSSELGTGVVLITRTPYRGRYTTGNVFKGQ